MLYIFTRPDWVGAGFIDESARALAELTYSTRKHWQDAEVHNIEISFTYLEEERSMHEAHEDIIGIVCVGIFVQEGR